MYQIWRGVYLPIDPKNIKSLSEEPGSYQQTNPVKCNVISGSKVKKPEEKKPSLSLLKFLNHLLFRISQCLQAQRV
jgi:hypothetical protein